VDRQLILRILHNRIWDKTKVLTSKELNVVEHTRDGVTIHCTDGSSFSGDILAGCDGIYSKTREEMWRLADSLEPGRIPSSDRKAITSEYQCLFGISNPVPGLKIGQVKTCYNKDESILLVVSKNYRVYWFLFRKYLKRLSVGEIPRYSPADVDKYAQGFLNYGMEPGRAITFADVWSVRVSCTLVPLEEAKFKVWTWGRIVCVGDSIHKLTPNAGQGGNAAIESAAVLANQIYELLNNSRPADAKPSSFEIAEALRKYQAQREPRVSTIIMIANYVTRIQAMKGFFERLVVSYIIPNAGEFLIDLVCGIVLGAEKLDFLPIPQRSVKGMMPFNPKQGITRSESTAFRALLALPILSILGLSMATKDPASVKNFGAVAWDGESTLIASFAGIYAVFMIESARRANSVSFVRLYVFFKIFYSDSTNILEPGTVRRRSAAVWFWES
jgi:2-polyprenyl-6-methoxyphenol hydroxylase-like FAD-dependent oxidoreductase